MKRIYSTLLLLCCTACLVHTFAQSNSSRLSVRRNNTTSTPATTTQSKPATTTAPKPAATTAPQTQTATPRPAATGTPQVQPKARAAKAAAAEETNTSGVSVRAQSQYSAQLEVPDAPIWKREVYRIIDMTKPANSGLADPLTPTDERMNLFTMIFKLLADKKLQAYEYTLDGNEHFESTYKTDFKNVLDRYHIPFRRKRIAATNDTVFVVDNSDIPSSEVMSYFIKEVWYFDEKNSTSHSTVTALCPVMHRSGDFDLNTVKYPMFWVKVSDLAPYMNQISIPTSEYNNAASVSLDDFFSMRMYKGDIYKTNNPAGKTLAQIATSDSAVVKEQKRIEAQLEGVENTIWKSQTLASDTTAVKDTKSSKKGSSDTTTDSTEPNTRRKTETEAKPAKSSSSSGGSSAPKASVRRERR